MDDDEADLRRFCGPVADRYLAPENRRVLDAMRAQNFALWPPVRSFCWPALFVPLQWLLFRKLYAEAAVAILLILVATLAVPVGWVIWLSAPLGLITALIGHTLYLHKIAGDRSEADRLGLFGEARDGFARRVGGRSTVGLWLGLSMLIAAFLGGLIQGAVPAAAPALPFASEQSMMVRGLPPLLNMGVMIMPSLCWLGYCFLRFGQKWHDRTSWLMLALGTLAAFIAITIEPPILRLLLLGAQTSDAKALAWSLTAGGVEEGLKLAVVAGIATAELRAYKVVDWPKLGMLVGFGFGLFEALGTLTGALSPMLALMRAATAVPTHGCMGALVGWGLARLVGGGQAGRWRILLVFLPLSFVHGLYDFALLRALFTPGRALDIGLTAPVLAAIVLAALAALRPARPAATQRRASLAMGALMVAMAIALVALGWQVVNSMPSGPPASAIQVIRLVLLVGVAPVLLAGELLYRTHLEHRAAKSPT